MHRLHRPHALGGAAWMRASDSKAPLRRVPRRPGRRHDTTPRNAVARRVGLDPVGHVDHRRDAFLDRGEHAGADAAEQAPPPARRLAHAEGLDGPAVDVGLDLVPQRRAGGPAADPQDRTGSPAACHCSIMSRISSATPSITARVSSARPWAKDKPDEGRAGLRIPARRGGGGQIGQIEQAPAAGRGRGGQFVELLVGVAAARRLDFLLGVPTTSRNQRSEAAAALDSPSTSHRPGTAWWVIIIPPKPASGRSVARIASPAVPNVTVASPGSMAPMPSTLQFWSPAPTQSGVPTAKPVLSATAGRSFPPACPAAWAARTSRGPGPAVQQRQVPVAAADVPDAVEHGAAEIGVEVVGAEGPQHQILVLHEAGRLGQQFGSCLRIQRTLVMIQVVPSGKPRSARSTARRK